MKKILAMIVAAALLLTGCSQVGAAATVGDTKITQATVQGSIDSILSERGKVDTSQMQLETGEALNQNPRRAVKIVTKIDIHRLLALMIESVLSD